MITDLTIKKVKDGKFESNGETIQYYWYKALREDGVTLDFGSKKKYDEGDVIGIELEKTEVQGGKFRYKEITE